MIKKKWTYIATPLVVIVTGWIFKWAIAITVIPLCEGWNARSLEFTQCVIGGIESLASDGSGLLLISSYVIGMPLLVFFGIGASCTSYWYWIITRTTNSRGILRNLAIAGVIMAALSTLVFLFVVLLFFVSLLLALKDQVILDY